ncbi:MAG: hypothetical protein KUG77_27400 [Nannocystaceae bacterium]|nr:hypothetical protein [Nannocystaceae bacterium]
MRLIDPLLCVVFSWGCAPTPASTPAVLTTRTRWTPYCCEAGDLEHPRGCIAQPSTCDAVKLAIECRPDDACDGGALECHCCRAQGTRDCVPSGRSSRNQPEPEPEPPPESQHRRSGTIWSPF